MKEIQEKTPHECMRATASMAFLRLAEAGISRRSAAKLISADSLPSLLPLAKGATLGRRKNVGPSLNALLMIKGAKNAQREGDIRSVAIFSFGIGMMACLLSVRNSRAKMLRTSGQKGNKSRSSNTEIFMEAFLEELHGLGGSTGKGIEQIMDLAETKLKSKGVAV